MSTPTVPFYPMTHDDAQEMIAAIRGQFDTTDVADIVAALRSGKGDRIPNGSVFTVPHAVYGNIPFITRARNQHKVAGDASRPTITIQPMYLLSNNGGSSVATFQYDRPEAFVSVADAIPANTVCKFTTPAYGGWAAGTYHFTATAAIAAGKKLCMSGYESTAMTSSYVRVYDSAKATTYSAQYAIASGDGGATVDLGTWGAGSCNHPQRVSYGSNNEAQSNIFQWLNADTGSGYMDSVFEPQTDFDMMDTSFTSKKGFLGGFSDEFRSYLGLCAIPNCANSVFETSPYAVNTHYTHNGYFFLPSRMEFYGSAETAYETDETQFPYFTEIGTTDADKLMYAKGASSPTSYWLRTPYAGLANVVRICHTGYGGALDFIGAHIAHGVAPLAILA